LVDHNTGLITATRVQASPGAQPTACSRYDMPSFSLVEVLLKAQQRLPAGSPSAARHPHVESLLA